MVANVTAAIVPAIRPWRRSSASSNALVRDEDLLRLALQAGQPIPAGRAVADTRIGRALLVADSSGANALEVIDAAIAAGEDAAALRRATEVALAQPRAVSVMLAAAPLVMVPILSAMIGTNPVDFYRTGVGMLVAATGGGLIAIGWLALVVLMRRASPGGQSAHTPVSPHPDEVVELLATALSAGLGTQAATQLVASVVPGWARSLQQVTVGVDVVPAGADEAVPGPLGDVVTLVGYAREIGAPVVTALRALAVRMRADDQARRLAATERLPVLMTLPTALCLMPGVVLLVGGPIIGHGLQVVTASAG